MVRYSHCSFDMKTISKNILFSLGVGLVFFTGNQQGRIGLPIDINPSRVLASEDTVSPSVIRHKGIVSFTFDDGDYSVFSKAFPLFEKYQVPATAYIPTKFVGQKWVQNVNDYNLNENTKNNRYMTWRELHTLEKAGWEIGDHSETHPNFENIDEKAAITQFVDSTQALHGHGFKGRSFATPFGSYHLSDLSLAAKFFRSHRGFWERGHLNKIEDRNNLLLNLKAVLRTTTREEMESWIDEAVEKGQWLILVFHIVDDNPGDTAEFSYCWPTGDLQRILEKTRRLVDEKKITVQTVERASAPQGIRVYADSMSDASLANWKVESARSEIQKQQPLVRIDENGHGAFPEPKTSMAIEGSQNSFRLTSKPIKLRRKSSALEVELYLNKLQFSADSIKVVLVQNRAGGSAQRVALKELDSKAIPVHRMTIQSPLLSSDVESVQLEIQVLGPSNGTLYLDEIRVGEMAAGVAT